MANSRIAGMPTGTPTRSYALAADLASDSATIQITPAQLEALLLLQNQGGTLTVAKGGTGATDAATARSNLGLQFARIPDAVNLVSTGGTGNLTLSAAAGILPGIESWPLALNAAGACWTEYQAVDRTSGAILEKGWGRITQSTRVLSGRKPQWTGAGTATVVVTSLAAVNVPAGAEVQFFLIDPAGYANNNFFTTAYGSDNLGMPTDVMGNTLDKTTPMPIDYPFYTPRWWPGGFVSTVSIWCGISQASTNCKYIIHESLAAGGPGAALWNGNGAPFSLAAAGARTLTISKFFPRQQLWLATVVNSTTANVALIPAAGVGGMHGSLNGLPVVVHLGTNVGGAYTAGLPDPAPTTGIGPATGNGVAWWLRPG